MSDAITTAKLIIKQRAYEKSGCHASLYAQAAGGRDGSSHVPCTKVAVRPRRQQRLLGRGRREVPPLRRRQKHYMAGILAYAREIGAIT